MKNQLWVLEVLSPGRVRPEVFLCLTTQNRASSTETSFEVENIPICVEEK